MAINFVQPALALAEGFSLAFSPCILPILPFILASSANTSKLRPFLIIGGFVMTFTVFSLISRSVLGALNIGQDAIQTGAYVLLLVFGIVMVVPWLEQRFSNATSGLAGTANTLSSGAFAGSTAGGLLVGALIGLVWIPCAGPILAAALLQVIQAQTSLDAVTTIAAFSIGAGIPMLLIALFGQYLTKHFRALSRHAVLLRRIMGTIIIIFAVLALSGVSIAEWAVRQTSEKRTTAHNAAGLQDGLSKPYATPQIVGITQWFNTVPLDIDALKGNVVLIDFWTYSCINCIRTLPYIQSWHEKYKDMGLVVIGVHSPEFPFEGKPANVEKGVKKFGLTYPVAMDNDFATWKNFDNKYWPAHYLIDKNGMVVYTHFGEGNYDVTENNIRYLLGLNKDAGAENTGPVTARNQTPETYLGTKRAKTETIAAEIPLNGWKATGAWKRTGEYLESTAAGETLTLQYRARKVFLVMESANGQPVDAVIQPVISGTADNRNGTVSVQESRLYEIVSEPASAEGTVTIRSTGPGLRLYVFTFES